MPWVNLEADIDEMFRGNVVPTGLLPHRKESLFTALEPLPGVTEIKTWERWIGPEGVAQALAKYRERRRAEDRERKRKRRASNPERSRVKQREYMRAHIAKDRAAYLEYMRTYHAKKKLAVTNQ